MRACMCVGVHVIEKAVSLNYLRAQRRDKKLNKKQLGAVQSSYVTVRSKREGERSVVGPRARLKATFGYDDVRPPTPFPYPPSPSYSSLFFSRGRCTPAMAATRNSDANVSPDVREMETRREERNERRQPKRGVARRQRVD